MATAPAEKKPNPNAPKPKQNLLMFGGGLILLGVVWFVYQVPGFIRPLSEEERKEAKELQQIEEEKARDAAREAAREAARRH